MCKYASNKQNKCKFKVEENTQKKNTYQRANFNQYFFFDKYQRANCLTDGTMR